MWPVFVLQFNCGPLSNDRGGVVHLIIAFVHQFLAILSILGCVGKLGITAFRRMFYLVNVASIRLIIQLRVFEQ
jgi:hypothetical protein